MSRGSSLIVILAADHSDIILQYYAANYLKDTLNS